MEEARKSRSYRDLDVWKLAIEFVKDIYRREISAGRDLGVD